ncbi:MAG: xanthine dehydrogenase accessory protein XdhC [Candidatus Obscuribacterales bacterium]|nr:xanthine dehydrogenase accessory protein XdhC [Candidatus Obscuribacterales bacterium]
MDYYEKVNELLSSKTPFVAVTVVDTSGSVPNDVGTKMLVTAEGLQHGTVGGGKVEKRAIEESQEMLRSDDPTRKTKFVNWSLEKDIGMTCGGLVKLYFEKHNCTSWQILVFGAGHVANALVLLLLKLDCKITCVDPRSEWLEKMPKTAALTKVQLEDMPSYVSKIPDNTFVLLMTMGHSTDKPILLEILKSRKFPYLGVIGSEAKAIRLRKDILEAGMSEEMTKAFYCPIGLSLGSNHPQEIAISIAAQLLQERDRLNG